jgi:hypothetical protein
MDRLWCRKVSTVLVSSVLTSSTIRRDTVDGIVRDAISFCSEGVSISQLKRASMTNNQAKLVDEIPVCAEYDRGNVLLW